MNPEAIKHRLRVLEARQRGLAIELDEVLAHGGDHTELTIALHTIGGMIKESGMWLESLEKYPAIERPEDLPTTASDPLAAPDANLAEVRAAVSQENAAELVKELPRLPSSRNGVGHA